MNLNEYQNNITLNNFASYIKNVEFEHASTPLLEVLKKSNRNNAPAVIYVVDDLCKPIGFITSKQVMLNILPFIIKRDNQNNLIPAAAYVIAGKKVQDIMQPITYCVSETSNLSEFVDMLNEQDYLPYVNAEGKLAGHFETASFINEIQADISDSLLNQLTDKVEAGV